MKKELKDKWVAALRSGKYTQGHGSLKLDEDCFCAMGVLYEVAEGEWVPYVSPITGKTIHFTKYRNEACLSDDLCQKFGISTAISSYIMRLNDADGFTFEQIAEYIENNVKEDND